MSVNPRGASISGCKRFYEDYFCEVNTAEILACKGFWRMPSESSNCSGFQGNISFLFYHKRPVK